MGPCGGPGGAPSWGEAPAPRAPASPLPFPPLGPRGRGARRADTPPRSEGGDGVGGCSRCSPAGRPVQPLPAVGQDVGRGRGGNSPTARPHLRPTFREVVAGGGGAEEACVQVLAWRAARRPAQGRAACGFRRRCVNVSAFPCWRPPRAALQGRRPGCGAVSCWARHPLALCPAGVLGGPGKMVTLLDCPPWAQC